MAGAPPGNQNAHKGMRWRMAIDRALEKRGKSMVEALDDLAGKLLDKAGEGDLSALKELGDRLDGKSLQPMDIKGDITANVKYNVTGLNRGGS